MENSWKDKYFYSSLFILRLLVFCCGVHFPLLGQSQPSETAPDIYIPADSSGKGLIKKRTWWVAGAHVAGWSGTFVALHHAWYKGFERRGFHTYNDMGEWQQMDKAGHVWTTYQMARVSGAAWAYTGMPARKTALLGGISGIAFQSIIEIQDGFSAEWGFSWGDMGANLLGAAAYVGQEWTGGQRFKIKLSYAPAVYDDPALRTRRDQLFGTTFQERILKDYNGQAYWLSTTLGAWRPLKNGEKSVWNWLGLAVGYRAEGMLGGYENQWKDAGGATVARFDVPRSRSIMLSPDIHFSNIPTRKKWVKTLLFVADAIKVPAPTILWNNKSGWRLSATGY